MCYFWGGWRRSIHCGLLLRVRYDFPFSVEK